MSIQDESKSSLAELANECSSFDQSVQDSNLDRPMTGKVVDTIDANDSIITKKYFLDWNPEKTEYCFPFNTNAVTSLINPNNQVFKNVHLVGLNIGFEVVSDAFCQFNNAFPQSLSQWIDSCDLISPHTSASMQGFWSDFIHALEHIYKLHPSVLLNTEDKTSLFLQWIVPFGFDNRVIRSPFVRGFPLIMNDQPINGPCGQWMWTFNVVPSTSIKQQNNIAIKRIYVEPVFRCNHHVVSEKNILSYREMNVFFQQRCRAAQNPQMLVSNWYTIPTLHELRGFYISTRTKNPNTNETVYSSDAISRIQITTDDNRLLYDKDITNIDEFIHEGNFLFIPWSGMDTPENLCVNVCVPNLNNIVSCVNPIFPQGSYDGLVVLPIVSRRIKLVKKTFDCTTLVRVLSNSSQEINFVQEAVPVITLTRPKWWDDISKQSGFCSCTPMECESIDELDARMRVLQFDNMQHRQKPWILIDAQHRHYNKLDWRTLHQLVCYGKIRLAIVTGGDGNVLIPKWARHPHANHMKPDPSFHVKVDNRPRIKPTYELARIFNNL